MSVARALFLATIAFGLTFFAPPLSAEAAVPAGLAIVDVQKILQASLAAQSAQKQLDAHREKFQTEIASEEATLREAERKLVALRESGAAAQVYGEEEQKLQKRFLTVERQVQARRKALDQALTDAMNTVRASLVSCVEQVAKEKGASLVLVRQQVIWGDASVDLTSDVLARLDKVLPQVAVTVVPDEEEESEKPLAVGRSSTPKTTKK